MHTKLTLLPLAAVAFAQTVQAHTSHSEGMQHASEHMWLLLVPAALWLLASVLKKHGVSLFQRNKRDED